MPARWRISYRVSLLIAIPALVVALSGLMIGQSYRAGRDQIKAAVGTLFGEVTRQAVRRTRDTFAAAPRAMDTLQTLHRDGRLPSDPREFGQVMVALLRGNPAFAWIDCGFEDGSFVGAYRTPARTIRFNHSRIVDGKTQLVEHDVADDGTWTLFREEKDFGYDPRKREWYRLAAGHHRPIWTSPYVFFGQRIPGITYAAPRTDRDGTLLGVFSIDFDLNTLSEQVRGVKVGDGGSMFVTTPDGTLLAHPQLSVVTGEGRLLALGDIADPVIKGFTGAWRALPSASGDEVRPFEFDSGGVPWLAGVVEFRADEQLTLMIGLAVPAREYLAGVEAGLRRSLLAALLVLVGGTLFAVYFANRIARPLVDVAGSMDRVGHFDLREPPEMHSRFVEIEAMERSLASMVHSLRSFGSYVPRDLVRHMLETGAEARLGGETRELTVFFSDIASFTTLAEGRKPDELVRELGGYFEELSALIASTGGTVDKFLGDGVMAFWGAPVAQADHALRAVQAAVRIQKRFLELRSQGPEKARRALATRIGLATGVVLVGNIGTSERLNYTVMGDTANLASRLEGLNKWYRTTTLVAQETAAACGDAIVFRPVEVVVVMGRTEGVRVLEPLCEAGDLQAAAARHLAAICGRALDAYLAADFKGAAVLYREALLARPGDPVSRVLAERCEDYAVNGPPKDWSAATKARSK